MVYFTRADIDFYYALADAYTICDANFCALMGGTHPNRSFLMTGTIDPHGLSGGPMLDNSVSTNGFSWTTYPERLQDAGISWKVYQQEDNFDCNVLAWFPQFWNLTVGNPLYDRGMARAPDLFAAFQSDITNGTLPRVSWVVPPSWFSEHPFFSPSAGAQVIQLILQALASNPEVFNSTVLILTYDEEGGFFDHVPSPTPPPGTADEFVNGLPIGMGTRVPMIIVSPWTRGGYVCSQVFDHTSVLRFLETWTGVSEPQISAWRRQVSGDLLSAFDFAHPDYSVPVLPAIIPVNCTSNVAQTPASPQSMPRQEIGTRAARPLPYQPNAVAAIDCNSNELRITMTNAGRVATHFAIYANAFRTDGPWQYAANPGSSIAATFSLATSNSGPYDFTCYGPNGFVRRFAGVQGTNCGLLEVTSEIDSVSNAITLFMQNFSAAMASFTISNAYSAGESWNYEVPAGSVISNTFFAGPNDGWYDLSVTLSTDMNFVRQLSGHVETSPLALAANSSAGNLFLSYPGWATDFVLEFSTNLNSGNWLFVNSAPTNVGNRILVTLPITGEAAYFRLRRQLGTTQ